MTGRYPVEDLNAGDSYGESDDGTIQENVETLAKAVIGRRIVSAEQGTLPKEREYSYGPNEGLVLTLDDGTRVTLADSSDCCAYTDLEGFFLDPASVDHIILGVGTTEQATTWHIYADFGDIMRLKVGWSCGNPFYYGYGFDINVVPAPAVADDGEAAIARERATFEAEDLNRIHTRIITPDDARREYLHGDAEREAFRAKLQAWRETGSIPNYTGPKAAR